MSFSLSVVIPSHNRPDLLATCLASVQRHAPPGTEILVVDDASPGGLATRVAGTFAGTRSLRRSRRRGFCVAANAGLRAARGEIVELLNDDTEVTAGWTEPALAMFADPAIAAVAPLVLQNGTEDRIDSAGDRYYLGGIAGKRGHGQRLGPAFLKPCRVFGASGSSAFYRRHAVLEVGAFPENFGAYFEDVDLAFRLNRAGWQVHYQPASRVWHRGGCSYARFGRPRMEQQSRNEERVFWRNLSGPVLRRALPRHGAVLAAKVWRRWGEGNLTPFLIGRLRAFAELPQLLRHCRCSGLPATDHDANAWQVEERFWNAAPGQKARGSL